MPSNINKYAKLSPNYDITIGIGPVNISLSLPISDWANSIWCKISQQNLSLGKEFINWCMYKILDDRLTEKGCYGSWGKSYLNFLSFIYDEDSLPNDISYKDSITFTSIVVSALCRFNRKYNIKGLDRILKDSTKYYISRQDCNTGGFGLLVKTTRQDSRVAVDLRHSAYAILGLVEIGCNPEEIIKGFKFINSRLQDINPRHERAITISVLHNLFSSEKLSNYSIGLVDDLENWKARFETELISSYDHELCSWDMDKDPVDKSQIDNAFFVLSNLNNNSINSLKLKELCVLAIDSILKSNTIEISDSESGICFVNNSKPDIGTTLQFLEIILTNHEMYNIKHENIKKMIKFVTQQYSNTDYTPHSYGWQIASALKISTI